jgi:glycosyltransferase involved in cell wall biosynthesis
MISILLATYNGEKYIQSSIQSVLNQTFTEWELLIGFNGTTDSSRDIVSSFGDDRIKIFDYGEEKGKAKTLNKLIQESSYDLCAIQDDDDLWHKDKLKEQINHINKFDVVGSFITYIDEGNKPCGGPKLSMQHEKIKNRSLLGDNQIANSSSVFKKQHALEIGGWDESLDGIEDFDFWIKLLKKGYLFHNIPSSLVFHRVHSESNFNTKKHDLSKIL